MEEHHLVLGVDKLLYLHIVSSRRCAGWGPDRVTSAVAEVPSQWAYRGTTTTLHCAQDIGGSPLA